MTLEQITVSLEWRWVAGYEGLYDVANIGAVRRHYKHGGERILVPSITKGYRHVTLSRGDEQRTVRIARLVAEAFIPNPENKPQVNHKDGRKHFDWVTNLEWSTASENTQHAVDMALRARVQGVALESQNGRPPWNKGKKTGQIPWNKSHFPKAA